MKVGEEVLRKHGSLELSGPGANVTIRSVDYSAIIYTQLALLAFTAYRHCIMIGDGNCSDSIKATIPDDIKVFLECRYLVEHDS